MPRRDHTPPYEIMRSRPGAPVGRADDPPSPEPTPGEYEPGQSLPRRAPWWVGSSAPLVLRLPRGLAVLSLAGVLLVIVLAYFVGTIRGAAAARPEPDEQTLGQRSGPQGYFIAGQDDYQGTEVQVPEQALTAERREPGKNYMRLIQSTEQDCRELAEFFGARGVAIQLAMVNNGRSCVAYAVKRGYRGDELSSESCKRYKQQLLSLGRQWKAHNQGRGTDLATMYFERYDGPRKPE